MALDYLHGVQNGETEWLNLELERQRFGLTDLILCEALQDIRDDASKGIRGLACARIDLSSLGT